MLFLLLLASSGMHARGTFVITADLEEAYELIVDLQFEEAQLVLDAVKLDQPNNFFVYHIENYIDFFKVFIGEGNEDFEQFRKAKDQRLKMIRQGDPFSPYFRFCQAEIHLQWALARIKFHEYIRAGWDINRAYKLLKENEKLFPGFELNQKSLSLIHSLVGSVTGVKKSLLYLFTSLEGSIPLGLAEIQDLYLEVQRKPGFFGREIMIIRALMALHIEKDAQLAWEIINHEDLRSDDSPLILFARATVALHAEENVEAIKALSTYEHASGFPFYYLDLMLAREKLNGLDPEAGIHLIRFIDHYRGRNYLKEAHQKMAWLHWAIHGDESGYREWMKKCLEVGQAIIGEDESAQAEAESYNLPHRELLKARLLFDGGHHEHALHVIQLINHKTLHDDDHLEYQYRKARILQKLGKSNEAIALFGYVLNRGKRSDSYFACNAALQMGTLFYQQGQADQSLHYLEECLDINPHQHRIGLHQKALFWKDKINREKSQILVDE